MSTDSTGTVETVETIDSNESPTRRVSPRNKQLKYQSFKGMQGSGSDEHYKLGKNGGAYKGKGTMKNAPKSAW